MRRSNDITSRGRARSLEGVPEGVDYSDPAASLIAAEEAAADEAPLVASRADVGAMLMEHFFEDGPVPERVALRMYQLTRAMADSLCARLPARELELLTSEADESRAFRMTVMLRGSRHAARSAEKQHAMIREVLASAWAKQRHLHLTRAVPSAALTDYQVASPRERLSQFQERAEAVEALLKFFFRDGAAPEVVVMRVFMVAKAYFDHLVLKMSLHHLAAMFGQVRATWSIRAKKKLNGFLEARGVSAVKAPYQKSDGVCLKYAAAAAGNRNRATGRRVA